MYQLKGRIPLNDVPPTGPLTLGSVFRRTRVLRLVWAGCALVVIIGSLLPGNSVPMQALEHLHINDKVQHALAYAVLALLPVLHEQRRNSVALLLIAVAMGVLLEF